MSADAPLTADAFPIRVLLEVDLDAQPIRGILNAPGGPPSAFIGWLGLTAALEDLRAGRELPETEHPA